MTKKEFAIKLGLGIATAVAGAIVVSQLKKKGWI